MPDMLVKLYDLPLLELPNDKEIVVRRALAPERHVVLAWVRAAFSEFWVSECEVAYTRTPAAIFVATYAGKPVGFVCYDTTALGMFGPTGVDESMRGRGIGKALLLAALHDMFARGYAYAVIGGVGPAGFYERAVSATLIPDSSPGIYRGMLRGVKTDET